MILKEKKIITPNPTSSHLPPPKKKKQMNSQPLPKKKTTPSAEVVAQLGGRTE